MHTLKRVFDFYIFSNIHVSLAVFCLTKITLFENGIESNLIPFFVFFSTVASYNFIRIYQISKIQSSLFEFIKKHKKLIVGTTFLSTLIVIYLSFMLQLKTLVIVLPFGLFTLFYVVPFPIKKNNPMALRGVAFLKLFLIAVSWAGVTVLIPLVNYDIELDRMFMLTFVQRFLFVVVITIPFDIRDMKFDAADLRTLPQVIGIQQSKVFGLFFLMVFLGLEFFKIPVEVVQLRIHLFVAVLSLYFLFKATDNQQRYYSAFFVEGIPIVWWVLVVFLM